MYRIGEFARLGSVSIRTLRYYDELGLLRPAHVDPETGYRAYEANQLQRLNRLIALKDLGFGLKETERLLGEVSAAELRGMLLLRRAELEEQMVQDSARLARVETRLRAIEQEDDMPDDISIKSLPAQRIAAIARPARGFGYAYLAPVLIEAFRDLDKALERSSVSRVGPPFSCYAGESDDDTLIAYACVPVSEAVQDVQDPAQLMVLTAVPQAATVVREGTYQEIYTDSRIYGELAKWLEAHGYVPAGAGRDVYLDDRERGPEDPTVVEVQWPVRQPGRPAPDVEPRRYEAAARA